MICSTTYTYIFRRAHFHIYEIELGFLSAQVGHCVHGDAAGHGTQFQNWLNKTCSVETLMKGRYMHRIKIIKSTKVM